ncbi:MAG: hypothetical protein CFE43_03485 [Burkholderiales bacterium PBB3]|nr:MAG: hypothetical protein CFE43_03485 [Burkholderiales bacterium PBB3]
MSLATVPVEARAGLHDSLHADVWHAHTLAAPVAHVVATGAAVLDAQLPGGGWPVGALTELLQNPYQHSEWRLLAPALARCGTAAVVLVAPPHVPFGPALSARGVASQRLLWVHTAAAAQRLWATEQALRCAGVDAVLAWLPQVRPEQLRRLQMAASEYNRLLFVMRPSAARQESSPAVLRLLLAPGTDGLDRPSDTLQVHIFKRRGPPLDHAVVFAAPHAGLAQLLAAAQRPLPLFESHHALDRTAA